MNVQTNAQGTGGSPEVKAPKVVVYADKTPMGNWLFKADVNGEFYSSSSCVKHGDAKAHIKQDLKEGGYQMPAEIIYR